MRSAANVDQALLDEIGRLARKQLPIAEICRRIGLVAERRRQTRPSYERVRVLVHEARERSRYQGTAGVLVDVALRAAPPDAVVSHLSGTSRRKR